VAEGWIGAGAAPDRAERAERVRSLVVSTTHSALARSAAARSGSARSPSCWRRLRGGEREAVVDVRGAGGGLPGLPERDGQPGRSARPQHARARPVRGRQGDRAGDVALAARARQDVRVRQWRTEWGMALDLAPL